ncbi:MAG: SRPBCC domain-containing protein [Desulfuromonas sp.]|nr:SRPBCC domain-containing protein [Desulfuromonas sp.]
MNTETATGFAVKDVERELVITRIFSASRELVWKAWTEPERMMRWWGPKDFTAPFCKIDLRVGGNYLYCMRSPDGRDYWATGRYRDIVAPSRLIFTDSFADEKGNVVPASDYGMDGEWPLELLVMVTFEAETGQTRMTLRHIGIPAGEMREMCAAGWNESFDKLAAGLAESP